MTRPPHQAPTFGERPVEHGIRWNIRIEWTTRKVDNARLR